MLMLPMTSTDISSPYQPDRDVDSTAYESDQGWQLKYHDIKTRRDAADARAKVRAMPVDACVVVKQSLCWRGTQQAAGMD